ncbi:MAG TPA: isoprenylcysteine carboxylmethyltransferase family protein [Lacunisphaera sp.]|nr:isoprenylcysteine carboxylmethyltransferase family protein [Lacunisphaera sp.]
MAAAVAATVVNFGLAFLGAGGPARFFSQPALTGVALVTLGLMGFGLFSGVTFGPGVREDRQNRWVFVPFVVLGLLTAFLPAWSDRHDFWTVQGNAVRWVGLGLFLAGGALRIRATFALGRQFSPLVTVQAEHALVTEGLYRVIRHPSYAGLLVNMLGWGLAFRSLVGVLLAVLAIPPVLARIRAEERLLQAHFGRAYDDYRARTARLIPGLY